MGFSARKRRLVLPAVIVLFVLEILLLPLVIQNTYATRSRRPEHILTYNTGRLSWDASTVTFADGSARLELFNSEYGNVSADGQSRVVAPGTSEGSVVRLKNDSNNEIKYTATLYSVKTDDALPTRVTLSGPSLYDSGNVVLPEGVSAENVIRSVSGTTPSGGLTDFDVDWIWDFEDTDSVERSDSRDTELGDRAAFDRADEITVGMYISVEDDGRDFLPSPKTGDGVMLGVYAAMLIISFAVIILLVFGRRKDKYESET